MNSCLSSFRRALRVAMLSVLTCAFCITCESARASSRSGSHRILANTTQGREFYITFPANLIDPTVTPNPLNISVCIASDYNTRGTLELLGPGKTVLWSHNFTVDSQNVTVIPVDSAYNNQTEIQDGENETPTRKAIHIVTNEPCVVYGLDHRPYTSDGYLAIPPASWGTDYRVSGYYGVSTTNEASFDGTSEFAVVAAYDSTLVNISLTAPTRDVKDNITHQAGDLVQVVLNKGQVYQMQAFTDKGGNGVFYDLAMSEITSSKPVGLISGSKCADVPIASYACDYIMEMIPPTQSWGKEFFTYQFDPGRVGGDLWRVYPLQNNTVVSIDSSVYGTVSPTDPQPWLEFTDLEYSILKNPAHWTFNKPVMLVQIITGEQYDGSENATPPRGDPGDVVLETREQFQTDVVYATPPDSYGYDNAINVFIDGGTSGTMEDSLVVDGSLVRHLPPLPYSLQYRGQVPGTNFWAFHIKVPGGIHRLSAKTPFSAYAVGLKQYESYGWPCSLSLKLIGTHDTIPPIFPGSLTCGSLTDTLTDLPSVDTVRSNLAQAGDDSLGIGWVFNGHYPDSTYNFNDPIKMLSLNGKSSFIPDDSAALVTIQVTNLRNRAHGALYAVDRAGNDTTYYYDYIPDSVSATPYFLNFGKVASNASRIDTITVQNPLSQNVTVDSIWLAENTVFTILSGLAPFPDTMTPGETQKIIVKFSSGSDSGFSTDTVKIKFNCFSRPLAVVGGGSGKPCVSVNNVDFGTLTILGGSVKRDTTIEIYNNGTDTLIMTGLKIGGGAGSAFSILSPPVPLTKPIDIFPGDSLPVQIHFSITTTGNYSDSLIISSDANRTCADSIAILTGVALQPGPNIVGFDWGRRRVACSYAEATGFTATNTGGAADTLDGLQVLSPVNDFVFSTVQLPLPIPANGGQGVIPVTFTPTDTGYRFAIVRAHFKSGVTKTDTLLKGIGVHPLISSQNVDFGVQSIGLSTDSFAVALNVPKTYFDALTINDVQISGADAGDFTFIDKNTPKVLANTGDTMQVRIAFSPTQTGLRQANLCFHHDGTFGTCKSDTTYCVTIQGTGQTLGMSAGSWDAGRVFITTTSNGTLYAYNKGALPAVVDSMWLSQNKVFHITVGTATKNITVPVGDSIPVAVTFTPVDTMTEYYDTLNVANNTQSPLVKGYLQGRGKVVIYTAVVPNGLHGYPGQVVNVPINVPEGYTRPSAIDPGDPTPLDSGSMNDLTMGLQFNPRVLRPLAADNSIFILAGTQAAGYTASRTASADDSVVFELTGTSALKDSGTIVFTNFRTLYSNVITMPIYDTVSSTVPYVIWKLAPGLFTVDSVCGLGPSAGIIYSGTTALGQNIPNPLMIADGQTVTIIPFTLTETANVQLAVYNTLGKQVANVLSGSLSKGLYNVRFDARNLPAGLYYYRLVAGAAAQTRTMMLMR